MNQDRIDAKKELNRLDRLVRRMRLVMGWEAFLATFWPVFSLICLFAFLGLIDLFPKLPPIVHGFVLSCFAGGGLVLLFKAFRALKLADDYQSKRRLEEDYGLINNPLSGIDDRPVHNTPATRALWLAHQKRQLELLQKIKGVQGRPVLAASDPLAIRGLAFLLLVIGLVVGWGDWGERLGRALLPNFDGTAYQTARVEAWITPPSWLGKPPVYVSTDQPLVNPLDVAEGSHLLVQISGLKKGDDKKPRLTLGKNQYEFQAIDDRQAGQGGGAFRLEQSITGGDAIAVNQGRRALARWPMAVLADTGPMAEFLAAPDKLSGARFRLQFEGVDDHGIKSITLLINHQNDHPLPNGDKVIRQKLPINGIGRTRVQGRAILDLSEHPWAGVPVLMRLEVTDVAGKKGLSDEMAYVLPERIFNHPVARDLVDARKKLSDPSQTQTAAVARKLNELSETPDHFFNDLVVYLAIRVAEGRLIYSSEKAIEKGSVQKLLWDTAIRIEDGELSVVERNLQDVQDRLQQALERGASEAELEQLMDELEEAMADYFNKLAKSMENKGRNFDRMMTDMKKIGSSQLKDMIERARQLARTGARDAALNMLADLRDLLGQVQEAAQSDNSQIEAMEKMDRALSDLQGIRKKQQELLDQNYQKMRNTGAMPGPGRWGNPEKVETQSLAPPKNPGGKLDGTRPVPGTAQTNDQEADKKSKAEAVTPQPGRPIAGLGDGNKAMAVAQEALRQKLDRSANDMKALIGQVPGGLTEANKAMDRARQAFGRGKASQAVPHQMKAVEKLQQSLEGIARQMAKQFSNGGNTMFMPTGGRPDNRDPFGRQGGSGSIGDGGVKIPGTIDTQRAWKILNELRRRAGELDRSQREREYLDRLLRQF